MRDLTLNSVSFSRLLFHPSNKQYEPSTARERPIFSYSSPPSCHFRLSARKYSKMKHLRMFGMVLPTIMLSAAAVHLQNHGNGKMIALAGRDSKPATCEVIKGDHDCCSVTDPDLCKIIEDANGKLHQIPIEYRDQIESVCSPKKCSKHSNVTTSKDKIMLAIGISSLAVFVIAMGLISAYVRTPKPKDLPREQVMEKI
ncbi:hypothetical protein F4777DRAFT_502385 [Nemania sp. FL0916]|nr:hypothetical protein F4777DRAFT_502385 [Nemania sp. FL0916]